MKRIALASVLVASLAVSSRGQMSYEEALARLNAREAQRAAAATQPDAVQPKAKPAEAPLPAADLSTQVQTLDSCLAGCFDGPIGSLWTAAQTQEWLNERASKASRAVGKLVGVETAAEVIVGSVVADSTGITVRGHLFPVSQRLVLSAADKAKLGPLQREFDAAAGNVADLQSEIDRLSSQRVVAQFSHGGAEQNILDGAASQLNSVQAQLPIAQAQADQAHAALEEAEKRVLQEDRNRMQGWGPIVINTQNRSLLRKLPGNIFTVRVRVTDVEASVERSPDGAGWEFSTSDAGNNEGQTHLPLRSGISTQAAPEVGTTITVTCQDMSVEGAATTAPSRIVEGNSAEEAAYVQRSNADHGPPPARGFVSTAHDDPAIATSVGFVVVGFEAALPDGGTLQRAFVTGSCFAVTSNGYLLTNRHVVESVDELSDPDLQQVVRERWNVELQPRIWVFFGTERYVARVQYLSPRFDLAVLKIARGGSLCFRLASQPAVPRGSDVFTLGFPGLGSEALGEHELESELKSDGALSPSMDIKSQFKARDFEFTLTKGAVGRLVKDVDGQRWIQHEAVIRHGNSGGPLINESGVVVGINTWIQHDEAGDVQTNMSLEVSQFRQELDACIPGLVWVSP